MRIRPAEDSERMGDRTARKVSSDTVSIGDRRFAFDSVFDSKSNQVLPCTLLVGICMRKIENLVFPVDTCSI